MPLKMARKKVVNMISKVRHLHREGLPYPTIRLNYWRPQSGHTNFGDQLSYVITSLMLAKKGYTFQDEAPKHRELMSVGSVLHFASEGATVWGSGINGKIDKKEHRFTTLDVRAVRGPLTHDFLSKMNIQVPAVYGDPALLLPSLAQGRFTLKSRHSTGFVPNLNDIKHHIAMDLPQDVLFIHPQQSWHKCIEQILSCNFILSTSLHGLVVAESYGIPARYVRLSKHENLFKYQDYYAGTGRPEFEYARSIAQGMEMGGERLMSWDAQKLMDAFPYDLWLR